MKLEKILQKVTRVKDNQVLCGIKMVFSGQQGEAVAFESTNDGLVEDAKERKPVKVPTDRSKGMTVVLVQNEDSFKSIYIFDKMSLHAWKVA